METYHSFNEIHNSKCLKFTTCLIIFLTLFIGILIGENLFYEKCECFNYTIN